MLFDRYFWNILSFILIFSLVILSTACIELPFSEACYVKDLYFYHIILFAFLFDLFLAIKKDVKAFFSDTLVKFFFSSLKFDILIDLFHSVAKYNPLPID